MNGQTRAERCGIKIEGDDSNQEEGETIALSRSYDDFKDKELIVKIGSSNAPIFAYKDKISKIVK